MNRPTKEKTEQADENIMTAIYFIWHQNHSLIIAVIIFKSARAYEGNPAFLLYSNTSMASGTQMASVAAKCNEETKSFMMAEKAGRSLKLHIQQYLIRSYLNRKKNSFSLAHKENTISHFPTESKAVISWLQLETVLWEGSQSLLKKNK